MLQFVFTPVPGFQLVIKDLQVDMYGMGLHSPTSLHDSSTF